jgi:hypothetical protein
VELAAAHPDSAENRPLGFSAAARVGEKASAKATSQPRQFAATIAVRVGD